MSVAISRRPAWIFAPAILLLTGAVILLTSLFVGWYTSAITPTPSGGGTFTETLYPLWVSNVGYDGSLSVNEVTNYSKVNLPHTGELYLEITAVVAAGATLALVAGILAARPGERRYRTLIIGSAVMAAVLAGAAPTILYQTQPPTICSEPQMVWLGPPPYGNQTPPTPNCGWGQPCDNDGCWTGSAGPPGQESSFVGSDRGYHAWGPSIGWWMSWVAWGALAIGSGITIVGYRKRR